MGQQQTHLCLCSSRTIVLGVSPSRGSRHMCLQSTVWDAQGTERQRDYQGEAVFFTSLALSPGPGFIRHKMNNAGPFTWGKVNRGAQAELGGPGPPVAGGGSSFPVTFFPR